MAALSVVSTGWAYLKNHLLRSACLGLTTDTVRVGMRRSALVGRVRFGGLSTAELAPKYKKKPQNYSEG
jgi:hypothetical protein